ncbi:MAG TPA: TerC family protein [Methylomirabilota bacterium]|jgi:predicted tellurium resistance membrane protein TerC
METFFSTDAIIALVTLSAMEIVLGIDNVVFIAILTSRLPASQQARTRRTGLALALVMRIGLLFSISWMMGLTAPLFSVLGGKLSGRDLILLGGGLFLIFKATWEIYDKLEATHEEEAPAAGARRGVATVLAQIAVVDVVFSLDSVITAVGMANAIGIMVVAIVVSMIVMLVSMEAVAGFIERHPSVKLLALAFLLLIGVMLVAEGFGQHLPKGYIYFAMAFSLFVELLNIRFRRRAPVKLHGRFEDATRT